MSIFSRLKKPATVEPRSTADATAKDLKDLKDLKDPKDAKAPHGASPPKEPKELLREAPKELPREKDGKEPSRDRAPAEPLAAVEAREEKPRRPVEPPVPKPNGVHVVSAKPAAVPGPPAKASGVIEAKREGKPAAPAPAAPAASAKQPDLAKTMVYGTPVRPPAVRPIAVQPAVEAAPAEPAKVSFDVAIEMALSGEGAAAGHGTSTAADQAAVRATFEDLAVPFVADVRSVMMELRWGEVQTSWFELVRPVLKSLKKMAEPVGQTAMIEAIDRFDAALEQALAPGQPATPSAPSREALLEAYEPLRTCLPRAFELEGERDRREPLIVRALLDQVSGLEPLMIDKIMAAGFGKLSALIAARADEIAAVTGIPDVIAAATVARVQAFRRATPAGLATVDRGETIRDLGRLLELLRTQHVAFEEVSRGWSEKDRSTKRVRRKERQQTLLQITIELARLGEVDLALRLDKLPFGKKIDELDRMIRQAALSAPTKTRGEAPATAGAAAAS
jgi:hypothetical protein